ncbi:hypothetical protein T09_13224 [Trichinella sp. T9]|nr:hypothetical protein T09_13224 [Trichinella sp. T9]
MNLVTKLKSRQNYSTTEIGVKSIKCKFSCVALPFVCFGAIARYSPQLPTYMQRHLINYFGIWNSMITSNGLKNGTKKKRNHGKHDAEQEKRREVKYFRIRARHEAEQEKTKLLDPNSVSLGLGYFKRQITLRLSSSAAARIDLSSVRFQCDMTN